MHLIDRILFVVTCIASMSVTGSTAMFIFFGWPSGYLNWWHLRSRSIDAIPLWYLEISFWLVAILLLLYVGGIRLRSWLLGMLLAAGLTLFVGYGLWSIQVGLLFVLPFYGIRRLHQSGA